MPDLYDRAERQRQSVLDLLHREGELSTHAITDHLGLKMQTAFSTLSRMRDVGEIEIVGFVRRVAIWRALAHTTRSATETRALVRNGSREASQKRHDPVVADTPGRYVNRPDRKQPIRNQGGQFDTRPARGGVAYDI